MDSADSQLGSDLRANVHNVRGAACLTDLKNQQYFIFKKINSSCQLLAGYTRVNTFYRSLLNLQKGLHRLIYDIKQLRIALQIKHCTSSSRCQPFNIVLL